MINTHFISTFSNNFNFPNILTNISSSQIITSDTYDSLTKENNEEFIKNEDKFYKKYQNLDNNSNVDQKLNKIKIYFITKSIDIESKKISVAIPINTLDDLSNSGYIKALTSRVGIFQMKTKPSFENEATNEGTPGNQPFLLQYTLECNGNFNGISDISLEDLEIPYGFKENNLSEEKTQLLQESKLKLQTQFIVDQNGIGKTINYYVYQDQYEYDYVFLDNTIFTNVERYCTNPRDRDNLKTTFIDKLKNLKDLNLSDFWNEERKTLPILETVDIFYKNTDELINKNIIPIFCDFEDAKNLLITTIEEILEPYKEYNFDKKNKLTSNINIDYIDDSFNFKNGEIFDNKIMAKLKSYLLKHRIIKSNIESQQHYQNYPKKKKIDNYQKNFNRYNMTKFSSENLDLYNGSYINDFDEVLFNMMNKTKIVSMGLGDFLYFLNNKSIKNGEILFIPSLKELQKTEFSLLPLVKTKSKDRFFEYQKEFRNKTKNYMSYYIYELENS
uniref:Hypothetical chloroplast protein n=4 Tax=Fucus TaxID=3011 RepID=A0A2R4QPW0_9PHAE|nr:hypothetical chloroplast protein [Fucus spiralis]